MGNSHVEIRQSLGHLPRFLANIGDWGGIVG